MDALYALSGLPARLRGELLSAFADIVKNYRERRWEPSELNGGKLCEIVYSILKGEVDGKMPARASKPRNMVDACRALESADPTKFPRSIRIQMPRLLVALYEIRNNRGVGHVGGDVNPNSMDAKLVLEASKWLLAELIRAFHDLSTSEATEIVEALVDRTVPTVWDVDGKKRVLHKELSQKDQTLLLLYSAGGSVKDRVLASWIECSNASAYRRDVLKKAHAQRLIEYNHDSGDVRISPTGIAYVEDNLPLD